MHKYFRLVLANDICDLVSVEHSTQSELAYSREGSSFQADLICTTDVNKAPYRREVFLDKFLNEFTYASVRPRTVFP